MAPYNTSQPSAVFTSWKEIAAYMGKGTRTVQRWERDYGLPVLRPNGKTSGIVSASRAELDNWWASHWSHKKKENGDLSLAPHGNIVPAWESIVASRELRRANRELVLRLIESTLSVTEECRQLSRRLGSVV
jgi:hypothetical protein